VSGHAYGMHYRVYLDYVHWPPSSSSGSDLAPSSSGSTLAFPASVSTPSASPQEVQARSDSPLSYHQMDNVVWASPAVRTSEVPVSGYEDTGNFDGSESSGSEVNTQLKALDITHELKLRKDIK
ncbi:hypothetical protein PFISCL1PPCAC_7545, partial [Pristionchus fissidentatus]